LLVDQVCSHQHLVQSFLSVDFVLKVHKGLRGFEELEVLAKFVEHECVNFQKQEFIQVVLQVVEFSIERVLDMSVQLNREERLHLLVFFLLPGSFSVNI
jgi:hypothetical protein